MTRYRTPALVLLLAVLMAAVIHHIMVTVYGAAYRSSILAGLYLLDGKPHWRVFQNRVLGPLLARTLSRATAVPDAGNLMFVLICFGTALSLAWRTGLRIVASRAGALAAMLTLALGLASLFGGDWFYAWDVAGIALFMIFAWLVARGAHYRWIVLLFAVTVWNRDDALFIALFLIVQPIVAWWRDRRIGSRPPFDWRQAATGVVCMAAGMAVIVLLRKFLLVEEMGPKIWGGTPAGQNGFFRWTLIYNLKYVHHLAWNRLEFPAFAVLPPLAVTAACVYLALAWGGRFLAYALASLAMTAATLMFGLIHEFRVWVDMLPVIVLATAVALANADPPARGGPAGR